MSFRVMILGAEYPHSYKVKDGIFIQDQAVALNRQGIRADVVFVEPRSLKDLSVKGLSENHFQITESTEDGVLTLRQKAWNPYMNSTVGGLIYAWLTCRLIDRYISKMGKPDIIHAHNTFWVGLSAMKISIKYNIPYIVTEHSSRFVLGSITKSMHGIASKVLAAASTCIAVSDSVGLKLLEYGAVKVETISNVVNTDFFSLPKLKRPEKFTFCAIGNMTKNKAFDVLLRAFQVIVSESDDDIRLIIGGGGECLDDYKTLCDQLGLSEKVTFLGNVCRDEVREILWASHALILPSYKETFGVVLIEALATGIPVIGSRCGGPESIIDENCGYIFEPGNFLELSEKMTALRRRSWEGNSLREYTIKRFSETALVDNLRRFYTLTSDIHIS